MKPIRQVANCHSSHDAMAVVILGGKMLDCYEFWQWIETYLTYYTFTGDFALREEALVTSIVAKVQHGGRGP